MLNANSKPVRPWRFIADEITRTSDPSVCLRLVEELNRALAKQGLESRRSELPKIAPTQATDASLSLNE